MLTFQPLNLSLLRQCEYFDIMQAIANTPSSDNKPILTFRLKVLHIISGDLWAGAEVQAYTLLTSLKDHCDLYVVLMNDGELANKLRLAGITPDIIDEREVSSIGITTKLVTIIRKIEPNLIHTHRQKENILASVANLASSLYTGKRIKSVRTTHGAPEHNAKGLKKIIIWLDRIAGKYAQDAVIAVSKDLSKKLMHTFPAEHIHTIENGIDILALKKLLPADDIRKHFENHTHIGIVGRLEPVKRVDIFIQTAKQLLTNSQKHKLKFHVIGDGKLKNDLSAMTASLDISDEVVFHGHRTDSTAAIAALDIVVMCSDHEGTPMTALETLALNKPLVAHNVGGLREVLDQYPDLLVNHHHADGYREILLNLIEHPINTLLNPVYTSNENAMRTLKLYLMLTGKNVG